MGTVKMAAAYNTAHPNFAFGNYIYVKNVI